MLTSASSLQWFLLASAMGKFQVDWFEFCTVYNEQDNFALVRLELGQKDSMQSCPVQSQNQSVSFTFQNGKSLF